HATTATRTGVSSVLILRASCKLRGERTIQKTWLTADDTDGLGREVASRAVHVGARCPWGYMRKLDNKGVRSQSEIIIGLCTMRATAGSVRESSGSGWDDWSHVVFT